MHSEMFVRPMKCGFRSTFQWLRSSQHFRVLFRSRELTSLKSASKSILKHWFGVPKSSFGRHKLVTKDHSIPENPTHRITYCYYLLLIILQSCYKDHSIQENQHIASHAIFCNHLAKLLQKIIASQTTPTHRLTCQPSATHQRFGQTARLFTNYPNISMLSFVTSLCSPNEDFGRPTQHFRMR